MKFNLNVAIVVLGLTLGFSAANADGGEELYTKHCKKCHAADGSGMKEGKPLAVVKTLKIEDKPELLNILREEAKKVTDADMTTLVLKGREKSDKGPGMKPLKEGTPEQAAEIVKYVRTLQAAKK